MSQYQLIAFDMDGTLLNSEKQITPRVAGAMQEAARLGKTVVISTGRCIPEMRDYMEAMPGVRYLICVSGALIYDCREKKTVCSSCMDEETVRAILDATRGRDIMRHLLGQGSVVEREQVRHMARYHMGIYRSLYERVTTQVGSIYDYYADHPAPVEKVNLYHADTQERELSRAALRRLPIELKDAEETSLECSAMGVNKGTGLMFLCRYLGIDPARTIAVGDAGNDIDILAAAGLSLAMGNAQGYIKEMCDIVLPDNDHDGCAVAVEKYLLGDGRH